MTSIQFFVLPLVILCLGFFLLLLCLDCISLLINLNHGLQLGLELVVLKELK